MAGYGQALHARVRQALSPLPRPVVAKKLQTGGMNKAVRRTTKRLGDTTPGARMGRMMKRLTTQQGLVEAPGGGWAKPTTTAGVLKLKARQRITPKLKMTR